MGCSREMRQSEKIMENIFKQMLKLNSCVWYSRGMKEEVHELVEDIQLKLTKMVNEFDNENIGKKCIKTECKCLTQKTISCNGCSNASRDCVKERCKFYNSQSKLTKCLHKLCNLKKK